MLDTAMQRKLTTRIVNICYFRVML